MKLLLTSCGIVNKTIENELKKMINKNSLDNVKMLYCTTASNYDGGNMSDWLVDNLIILKNLGFQIDVCDINGISKEMVIKRLEWADVFFFEGGNTQWLCECIRKKDLKKELYKFLENKIWIGASAGSCVLCPTLCNSVQDLFDETIDNYPIEGMNFVDFQFVPHLNNEYFPEINIDNIKNASKNLKEEDGKKVYIVDDNGAVSVNDDIVKIVSEGVSYVM